MAGCGSSKSPVWEYFSVVNGDGQQKVKCGICHALLAYGKTSSTSSMNKHLSGKHDIELTKNKKATTTTKNADQTSPPDAKQPKLSEYMVKQQRLKSDSQKAKALTHHIAQVMFLDLRPLSIVEDAGFRGLMQEAEKRYVIPTRSTFRNNILPELYQRCAEAVKRKIKAYKERFGAKALYSITTDGWTSSSNLSIVSYTLHIVHDFEIQSFTLGTVQLSQRHTAANLRGHLMTMLQEWGIFPEPKSDRAAAIVTDDEVNDTVDYESDSAEVSGMNNNNIIIVSKYIIISALACSLA